MVATFWMRVLAHNIDLVILLAPFYGLSFLIPEDLLFYHVLVLVYLLYHTVFELSSLRGSPGKFFNKLSVMHKSGDPLPPGRIIIRNLCKVISALPFFLGYTLAMFNKKNRHFMMCLPIAL